jgi:hypothetical protein
MKKEKSIIEKKWLKLKEISKSPNPSTEQIDELTCDLLANLAELSIRGVEEVDGVSIDLMKDRTWWIIEKHGLLPEYKDPEEEGLFEIVDEWEKHDDDFEDTEIDDSVFYR